MSVARSPYDEEMLSNAKLSKAMLFVERCAGCDDVGSSPCRSCIERLSAPPELSTPAGLDFFTALFAYEDVGRRLVAALKFHQRRGALEWMGAHLAHALQSSGPQLVTWVPSSLLGQRERGFDTGELLAREVGHHLRLPVRQLLQRSNVEQQSARNREQRHVGPSIKPTRWAARRLDAAHVIVIDDVSTTGASMSAAARVLKDHCAVRWVDGAAAARTPRRI